MARRRPKPLAATVAQGDIVMGLECVSVSGAYCHLRGPRALLVDRVFANCDGDTYTITSPREYPPTAMFARGLLVSWRMDQHERVMAREYARMC